VKLGDTFLLRGGHLWVVSTLPAADGSVVMFNFSSFLHGCDDSCVLYDGEHPFIRHDTFVFYAKGLVVPSAMQKKLMSTPSEAEPRQPVSAELLERIQLGALESDFTPQKIQKAVQVSRDQQQGLKKAGS
jgi:hypothetical protein